MTVRPLGSRVLIKKIADEEISAGGIHLVDSSKPHQRSAALRGQVVEVGPGYRRSSGWDVLNVSEGDFVLYGPHVGDEIEVDGVRCVVLHEDSILAVVTY